MDDKSQSSDVICLINNTAFHLPFTLFTFRLKYRLNESELYLPENVELFSMLLILISIKYVCFASLVIVTQQLRCSLYSPIYFYITLTKLIDESYLVRIWWIGGTQIQNVTPLSFPWLLVSLECQYSLRCFGMTIITINT